MVTRQIAISTSGQFIKELRHLGYNPHKAYLFGSVASGMIHEDSDIDLAIWDDKFSGCLAMDYEPIRKILVKYSLLEVHTFNTLDDEASNPLIAEILSRGFPIDNIS
ncbi:MAG: nucleotidyltransferase domain-containing protein [Bacteroidia bacterium]|nr:nucleotidyltransferase domain-containing protein [Bacteroidia bacterium]